MGHNLNLRSDGTARMFSGQGLVPWHGLGKVEPGFLTAEEGLVAAGLDYECQKVQNRTILPSGREVVFDDSYSVYRTDTEQILSSHVGSRYEIIQNSRAFSMLDDIAGTTGKAVFDSAGALGNGETVWMSMKLPEDLRIGEDEVRPYFVCVNSHDGSSALMLYTTPVRIVCQNTLNMSLFGRDSQGLKRSFKIKHTANFEGRVEQAKKIFGFIEKYYKKWEDQANFLLMQEFSQDQFKQLCLSLAPRPAAGESEKSQTRWENKFKTLMGTWNASDLRSVPDTKWKAYNAIADFNDHVSSGLKGSEQEKVETLFLRSFADTDLKDKALDLLMV